MIDVRFFGKLGDIASQDMRLNHADVSTVRDILDYLATESSAIYSEVTGPQVLIAVNQQIVTADFAVNDGDEVAFLPPVTGG